MYISTSIIQQQFWIQFKIFVLTSYFPFLNTVEVTVVLFYAPCCYVFLLQMCDGCSFLRPLRLCLSIVDDTYDGDRRFSRPLLLLDDDYSCSFLRPLRLCLSIVDDTNDGDSCFSRPLLLLDDDYSCSFLRLLLLSLSILYYMYMYYVDGCSFYALCCYVFLL